VGSTKKKVLGIAAIGASTALVLAGCTASSTDSAQMESQQTTEAYQEASQKAVPYPLAQMNSGGWLERQSLKEHLLRQNDPNAIRYIVLLTNQGQVIAQYTIKGMVFDPNSQMTNDNQLVSGWSGGSSNTYYNEVVNAPGDNGTWGPEAGNAAFFTAQGVEIQVPIGVSWVESDAPLDLKSTPLITLNADAKPSVDHGGAPGGK
jgi:hypothetical protein